MAQNELNTDIQFLPGVGPKRADLLKKELAVETVGQLLRIYPFRYIDRSSLVRICDIRPDMAFIQLKAKVLRVELYGKGPSPVYSSIQYQNESEELKFNIIRRMCVWVGDETGELEMVFFKGIKWMFGKLRPGSEFIFFGKPSRFGNRVNIVHPDVDPVKDASGPATTGFGAGSMTGVYPSTDKLKNGGITGKVMNKLMESALGKGLTVSKRVFRITL